MTSTSKMERTRYVIAYYHYERMFREDELRKIFTYQLNRLFGIKGSLDMGFFLVWVHPSDAIVILRSSHDNIGKLLCCTFFITEFMDKPLSIIPLKTTGSIKKAKSIALSINWNDQIK